MQGTNRIGYFTLSMLLLFLFAGCGTTNESAANAGDGTNPTTGTDTNAPVMTLNGDEQVTLFVGDTYTDPGARAMDNLEGDISSKVSIASDVDYTKAGNYTISYSVSDRAGNATTVKRNVNIYQTINTLASRSGLTINEIMASNASTNLDPEYKSFSDWIELYNNSANAIDLGGFFLSDNKTEPKKWTIPNGTTIAAGGYQIIWLDKKDSGLHANFSLNSEGESITLYDRSASEIDSITFAKQKSDVSCAKMDDTLYYMTPTPGFHNTTEAITPAKRSKKPTFSQESGFYTDSVMIELAQVNNADIYYTTDGSIPTKNSTKYTAAISLN